MPACPSCGKDNPADFTYCGHCRTPLREVTAWSEERKLATIVFADLTGSVELGERLDPERLRSVLQRYFIEMAAAVDAWGGTIEKYIGDAALAVFGAPVSREDDAERAVRAALEMFERLDELNPDLERQHGVRLQIHIGVNTGEVITPAGAEVDQRIVAGDAVNVAARLEQAAEPGTIFVGERTFTATHRSFRFAPPIPFELKGKSGIVQGYRLLGREPGMEGERASTGLATAMVGRDRELGSLLEALADAASSGEVRAVLVLGAAGIGKSRLLHEFMDRAALRDPTPAIYRGRCLATGRGITYWALGEMLRSAFGIAFDDAVEVAAGRVHAGVRAAMADAGASDDDVRITAAALAVTAGLPLAGGPLDGLEPEEVGDQIARAWPRFVTALAGRGPTILVVEDLHWADDQLLEILRLIATRSQGPVLIVGTARPEFAASDPAFTDGIAGSAILELEPLSDDQSAQLVAGLLVGAELPADLRARMTEKAEGNPLFLEEMVRRLIDEGVVVREADGWVARAGAYSPTLPDTVLAVLAARIDALPPVEKRALQEASVVGRSFWAEPLARTLRRPDLTDALAGLEAKGLLRAQPVSSFAGNAEHRFAHALIRDVAYGSLPVARRARAHAEVASWMTAVAGDRSEEVAELIADHYVRAVTGDADLAWFDEPERRRDVERAAFDALLFAGSIARSRYAVPRAVELHTTAVALASTRADRAKALEAAGDDHEAAIHGDEALSAYRDAISLLRDDPAADGDRGRVCKKAAELVLARSGAFSSMQEPAMVDDLVLEGLSCASDPADVAWLRALWGAAAIWWRSTGGQVDSFEDRTRSLSTALDEAGALELPELEAFAREFLCEVHMARGSYERVAELSREVEVFDRISSPAQRSLGLVETAIWARDVAGEPERALDLGMRGYELARDLSAHDLMHATGFVIPTLLQLGRWRELDPILDAHVAAFAEEADATCELLHAGVLAGATRAALGGDAARARELGDLAKPFVSTDPLWAGYVDCWRARLRIAEGDADEGLRLASAARGSSPPWPRLHATLVVLEALSALDDPDALAAFLPDARRDQDGFAMLPPACDRAEGDFAAVRGDPESAGKLWLRSLEAFEALGVPYEAAGTKERLASVSPPDEAQTFLRDALLTYDRMGARPATERVELALK
ncbi:MAG TPA: adenylate/guanylate cyclase domain-containing protein [Actinomycetota bacterium]|nr:adenylate/guanylate cyclase domain-containing protein [Actinomycetota bacterium]